MQVLLQYVEPQAEALGLAPTEAALQLRRTFAVSPGPAHELRLGMSVDARKCLNAGRVADRIVLPQTTLSILDRSAPADCCRRYAVCVTEKLSISAVFGHMLLDGANAPAYMLTSPGWLGPHRRSTPSFIKLMCTCVRSASVHLQHFVCLQRRQSCCECSRHQAPSRVIVAGTAMMSHKQAALHNCQST